LFKKVTVRGCYEYARITLGRMIERPWHTINMCVHMYICMYMQ